MESRGIYNPNPDVDCLLLWEELVGWNSWWDLPRCIGGEFNKSRFSSERSGAANLSIAMEGFSDSIFEQGLMDSSHQGVNFTWSNN